MQLKKRTPCVGICSTTYGDLVCRGCKRFAHEIVQWNGYDEAQQDAVRERLQRLRDEVLEQVLLCNDPAALQTAVTDAGLSDLPPLEQQYQLLRFMVRREQPLASAGLASAGLTSASPANADHQQSAPEHSAEAQAHGAPGQDPQQLDTLALMQRLDAEIYQRAKAHYERNFKVPA